MNRAAQTLGNLAKGIRDIFAFGNEMDRIARRIQVKEHKEIFVDIGGGKIYGPYSDREVEAGLLSGLFYGGEDERLCEKYRIKGTDNWRSLSEFRQNLRGT
jgi:hypothetical protein